MLRMPTAMTKIAMLTSMSENPARTLKGLIEPGSRASPPATA
jgi:hypothetical protein